MFVRQAPIPQMQMMPYNVSVACTNLVALPTKSITGRSERLGQLPWNQILRLLKVVDLKVTILHWEPWELNWGYKQPAFRQTHMELAGAYQH